MACCTSVPYFMTSDREQYVMNCDSNDLLMYDISEDDESPLMKCLALITSPDSSLSSTLSLSGVDAPCCPLLNDCMWSAGMLPPDLKAATLPVSPNHDCVSWTAIEDSDVNSDAAVDPSLISPCPHVTSLASARHVIDPGTLVAYVSRMFHRRMQEMQWDGQCRDHCRVTGLFVRGRVRSWVKPYKQRPHWPP